MVTVQYKGITHRLYEQGDIVARPENNDIVLGVKEKKAWLYENGRGWYAYHYTPDQWTQLVNALLGRQYVDLQGPVAEEKYYNGFIDTLKLDHEPF